MEKESQIRSQRESMERRTYVLGDREKLLRLRDYLERQYVARGFGRINAKSKNLDYYSLDLECKELSESPSILIVILNYQTGRISTLGNCKSNGRMKTEFDMILDEMIRTERICKEDELRKALVL